MISYAQEQLREALPESKELLLEQWQHTGDSELPQAPNWKLYLQLADKGALLCFVAREDGRPIGYLLGLIHQHVNSMSTKVATISTYFVEDRAQRVNILRNLIAVACRELQTHAVARITIETEYAHSAGRLLEALGFSPVKIGYMLKLDQEEAKSA